MEHLNRVCKRCVRGLGVNKTEVAIGRLGKAIGTVASVIDMFDKDNDISHDSGGQKSACISKDLNILGDRGGTDVHSTPAPKASMTSLLHAIAPPRQGIHLENFNVIIQSDPPSGTQYISLTVQNLPSLQPPPYFP